MCTSLVLLLELPSCPANQVLTVAACHVTATARRKTTQHPAPWKLSLGAAAPPTSPYWLLTESRVYHVTSVHQMVDHVPRIKSIIDAACQQITRFAATTLCLDFSALRNVSRAIAAHRPGAQVRNHLCAWLRMAKRGAS